MADVTLQFIHGALVVVARAQLIAGGEDMTGVEADADAARVVHAGAHLSQFFERTADARSLSRGCFEQRDDAMIGNGRVHCIERSRDLIDGGVRARAHVRAGMQHDSVDAQSLGAIELVDHGRDRFPVNLRICRGQVDEIRGVREQRLDGALRGEGCAVLVGEHLSLPLNRVLRPQRSG